MRVINLVVLSIFALFLAAQLSSGLTPASIDSDQNNDLKQKYVDIDFEKNLPPVAYFDYSPSSPKVGDLVTFDASKSYDPDGKIVEYRWSYLNMEAAHFPVFVGYGEKVRYSWNQPGYYLVTLQVTDNDGLKDVLQKKIHVDKALIPPSADFSFSPSDPRVGEEVVFDASESKDDGKIVEYRWDFGDGKTGNGERIAHVYSSSGSYIVTLTVIDDDGLKDSITKGIDIKEQEIDTDGDGIPDSQDPDDDNDGVADTEDEFPKDPNEWQDTDGDGIGDNADPDDDNDGWSDEEEINQGTNPKDPESYPSNDDNNDNNSDDEDDNEEENQDDNETGNEENDSGDDQDNNSNSRDNTGEGKDDETGENNSDHSRQSRHSSQSHHEEETYQSEEEQEVNNSACSNSSEDGDKDVDPSYSHQDDNSREDKATESYEDTEQNSLTSLFSTEDYTIYAVILLNIIALIFFLMSGKKRKVEEESAKQIIEKNDKERGNAISSKKVEIIELTPR